MSRALGGFSSTTTLTAPPDRGSERLAQRRTTGMSRCCRACPRYSLSVASGRSGELSMQLTSVYTFDILSLRAIRIPAGFGRDGYEP